MKKILIILFFAIRSSLFAQTILTIEGTVIINPDFINTTAFVPAARLDYGTDWQTGLSIDAVWGTIDPSTTNQNGTWQVGAHVYAGNIYYISSTGDDVTGNGSIGSPWFTLHKAWQYVSAGDIIYMRGGTYYYTSQQTLTSRSGTSGNTIKIYGFEGEHPIINMGNYSGGSGDASALRLESISYVHFKNIRITNLPQPVTPTRVYRGIWVRSNVSNCTFEQIETDHIGGWGCALADNISSILFLNCDSHHNQDPYSENEPGNPDPGNNYGGADGWQMGDGGVSNITFRGCRAYANSDDGWDTRVSPGIIRWENCWSFWNGYIIETITAPSDRRLGTNGINGSWVHGGDGEAFKIAGEGSGYTKFLTNCLAFENWLTGIHPSPDNSPYGTTTVFNCTAYANWEGFACDYACPSILRNNISFGNITDWKYAPACSHDHNTSDLSVTVSDADFVSVSSVGMDGPRQADGSLPILDFLRLASTSDLIGAGVDVGLPYSGKHPDLGAYEFNGENHPPSIMDQSFEIDENSLDGTVVDTIVASDPDMDQTLEYSILSGNTGGAFTINDSTGVLSVANSTALNVDFALVVKVQDNGTDNLSSQATITINIIPVGIDITENNSIIKIYPNPVSDELIIEIEGNNDRQGFEIFNSIGNIIFKGNLSGKTVVSTINFSSGIYYIQLQNGKAFEFKKIIKP